MIDNINKIVIYDLYLFTIIVRHKNQEMGCIGFPENVYSACENEINNGF